MKKLAKLVLAVAAVIAIMAPASEAYAGGIHVSGSATPRVSVSATSKVIFRAKLSRRGLLDVVVYKGSTRLRTLRIRKMSARHVVVWNMRDARGRKMKPGVFRYQLAAVSGKRTGSARGHVHVKPPVTTMPTTPPPATPPTATPDPGVPPTGTVPSDPATETTPSNPATEPAPVTPPVTPPPPSASTDRWIGFYVPDVPRDMTPLEALESQAGSNAKVVNFFISDTESFPTSRALNIANHGATPLVTLEFWSTQSGGLSVVTNGSKDAYLTKFADDAKAYGGEVWLRPFHEMNGNWYPWGGTMTGNTSAQLVAAWRHVHDVLESRGATNVKLVWCVNNDSVPSTSANAIEKYWPGDAYVDLVALDGYNAGTTASWSTWRSFGQTFSTSYTKVTGLTQKPLFIAETGCVEQGGSKAAWITGMFQSIQSTYKRVRGVCWFNANKEHDWRVESSSSSLAAYRTEVADGF